MRCLWGLMVAVLGLSGCATFLLSDVVEHAQNQQAIKRAEQTRKWEGRPLEARRAAPRHLICRMVCDGAEPAYQISAADIPLFLILPVVGGEVGQVTISEHRPSCVRPRYRSPPLDLVLSSSLLDFQPRDTGDHPTLALLYMDLVEFPDSGNFRFGSGSYLLYSREGRVIQQEIHQDLVDTRTAREDFNVLSLLYLLSIPVDVVTSPVQLAVFVVVMVFTVPLWAGNVWGR